MSSGRLRLKIVTPTRVVVDEEVAEVCLPGALGVLGILPGHAPLLASLRIGEAVYRQGAGERWLALQRGFVEVVDDQVTVLADAVERPAEIDLEAAHTDRAAAEQALKSAAGEAFDLETAKLETAVTRIAVATRR
jgi:F-type H+-transporting ATPase subunit epsilon